MKTIVLSLGGSIIARDNIDVDFLKRFKKVIIGFIKENNKAAIVCGGGKTARDYINAGKSITTTEDIDDDLVGIMATRLNAELVRAIFSEYAYEKVVINYEKPIKTNKKIIIGAGWKPRCSTDKDAVLMANNLNSSIVVNMTDVDYVYDKNPKKYKDAKPLKRITWQVFRKIVGNKWKAGLNLPFDPVAAREAEKLKLKVIVLKGNDLENFKNFLNGRKFKGTVIS